MATNFRDDAGIVRLDGTLYAPGASVGDVLTVQADGSLAPAAGGGSQPVKDLGLVNVPDLIDGAQTLYTPQDGEFVVLVPGSPSDFVQIDNPACSVIMGQYPPLIYGKDVELTWDQATTDPRNMAIDPFSHNNLGPIFSNGTLTYSGLAAIRDTRPFLAAIAVQTGNDPTIIASLPAWQALHGYVDDDLVRGSGHIWVATGGGGNSGASEPDWASNFGGSVVDGDVTWFDEGAFPATGALHMYAIATMPVVP